MKWLSAYPREVKVFLVASLINSAGGSLMWPLITMFVFKILGRSVTDAGLVILVMSLGGIAGQLLGGALYHRLGVTRLIVGGLGLNALFLLLLPYGSGNWHLFMLLIAMVGFFNAMSMPAIQAFIGFRFAERRGELFNVIYVANNIGVAVGTALSGFLAQISYDLSFILNGLTSAAFAVFLVLFEQSSKKPRRAACGKTQNRRGRPERVDVDEVLSGLFVYGHWLIFPMAGQLHLEQRRIAVYDLPGDAGMELQRAVDAERGADICRAAFRALDQADLRRLAASADDGQRCVLYAWLRDHFRFSHLS